MEVPAIGSSIKARILRARESHVNSSMDKRALRASSVVFYGIDSTLESDSGN